MLRMIFLLVLLMFASSLRAGDTTGLHGKTCAVCLTYDDGLNVHLDNVVPALDSLGFRATFYVAGSFPSFNRRLEEWRAVAARGHELGNHTLFHPCEGKAKGREWVKPEYDLNSYTVARMVDEIDAENVLLRAIDGKERRTFAYPCGDMRAGDSSYVDRVRERFVAARGVKRKLQTKDAVDRYDVGATMINGESGDELVAMVKDAQRQHALLVFLFHGVGGEHSLSVSLPAHRQLLQFLKDNEHDIWVAPLVDIMEPPAGR